MLALRPSLLIMKVIPTRSGIRSLLSSRTASRSSAVVCVMVALLPVSLWAVQRGGRTTVPTTTEQVESSDALQNKLWIFRTFFGRRAPANASEAQLDALFRDRSVVVARLRELHDTVGKRSLRYQGDRLVIDEVVAYRAILRELASGTSLVASVDELEAGYSKVMSRLTTPSPGTTFSTAVPISVREFVRRVGAVQLEIDIAPDALTYFSRATVTDIVQQQLAVHGVRVATAAPVRLSVGLWVYRTDFTQTSTRGERIERRSVKPIHQVLADVEFELLTSVLRGNAFYPLRVSPANAWTVFGTDDGIRDHGLVRQSIEDAFKRMMDDRRPSDEWYASALSPADRARLDAAFESSRRAVEVPAARFRNMDSMSIVPTYLDGEANRFVSEGSMTNAWVNTAGALGARARPDSRWELITSTAASFGNAAAGADILPQLRRLDGMRYYNLVSHYELREPHVVFTLNDVFLRKSVRLHWGADLKVALPQDVCSAINGQTTSLLNRFINAFTRNAPTSSVSAAAGLDAPCSSR